MDMATATDSTVDINAKARLVTFTPVSYTHLLSRIRGLVSRSPSAPRCVEEVIGEAVQVLVFIERTPSGRRIREILAVDGYSIQKQEYQLSEFTA